MRTCNFFTVLFLFVFTACFSSLHTAKEISCRYAAILPGSGNKALDWRQADSVCFENQQESDNKTIVKTLWNEDSLYICFQVDDKDLRAYQTEKDHPRLYLDDMVEVLIDAYNDKGSCWNMDDIVYHINLFGQKKDDRGTSACITNPAWDGNAVYTLCLNGTLNDTTDTDCGYHVEIAFPWSELRVNPVEGRKIGIDFANGDNDGKGRQLYDWVGATPMRSPHMFGTLKLVKNK